MSYSSQESYLENCEMCDYDVKRSSRNEALVCHVDGSCKRNGRHDAAGGFGCIIKSRKNHYPKLTKKLCCELKPYLGRGIDNISNQSAELMAVYKALCVADYNGYGRNNEIAIHTDSKYVHDCLFRDRDRWERNGFKTSKKTAVKHQVLIRKLYKLYDRLHVNFYKCYGHSGCDGNDYADELAVKAATRESIRHFGIE